MQFLKPLLNIPYSSMKTLLKLPTDRQLHSQLEQVVRKFLSSENDKDVSIAIRHTIFELDRTAAKVRM